MSAPSKERRGRQPTKDEITLSLPLGIQFDRIGALQALWRKGGIIVRDKIEPQTCGQVVEDLRTPRHEDAGVLHGHCLVVEPLLCGVIIVHFEAAAEDAGGLPEGEGRQRAVLGGRVVVGSVHQARRDTLGDDQPPVVRSHADV
jgi:hypothetical protein